MAKGMRNTYMYSMLTKTGLQNRKAQFAADAAKAMEEYLAEPEAVRIRTIRLRAQRLERDACRGRRSRWTSEEGPRNQEEDDVSVLLDSHFQELHGDYKRAPSIQ
jgi:hypothetical protein